MRFGRVLLLLQLWTLSATRGGSLHPLTKVSTSYRALHDGPGGLPHVSAANSTVFASMLIVPALGNDPPSLRKAKVESSAADNLTSHTHIMYNCTSTPDIWNLLEDANVLELGDFQQSSDSDSAGFASSEPSAEASANTTPTQAQRAIVAVASFRGLDCFGPQSSSVGRVIPGNSFFGAAVETPSTYFYVLASTVLNDTNSATTTSSSSFSKSCVVRLDLARATFAEVYPSCKIKVHSTDLANLIRSEAVVVREAVETVAGNEDEKQARRHLDTNTLGFAKDAACSSECGDEGGVGEIDVDKCWAQGTEGWAELQCTPQFYQKNSDCSSECGYEGGYADEPLPTSQCYDCHSGADSCGSGYTSTGDGCCRILECLAVEDTTITTPKYLLWNLESDAMTVTEPSYSLFEIGNCSNPSDASTDCCRVTCENCFLNVSIASMYADVEIVGADVDEELEIKLEGNANLQVEIYAPNGCTLDTTAQLKNISLSIPLGETGLSLELSMTLDLRKKLLLQPHGSTAVFGATTVLHGLTAGSLRSERFYDLQLTSNATEDLAQSSIDIAMELELIPTFQASISLLKGLGEIGVKAQFIVFLELNSSVQFPEPFAGLSSEYLDTTSLWHGGDCRLPHFMEYNGDAGYGDINITIPMSITFPVLDIEPVVVSSSERVSYSLFSGCIATAYDADVLLSTALDAVSLLSNEKKVELQKILVWALDMTDIDPDFVNITSVSVSTGEIAIELSVPPSLGEVYPTISEFKTEVYQRARTVGFASNVSAFVGLNVSAQCETGWWGAQCDQLCSVSRCSSGSVSCNAVDGTVFSCGSCNEGYWGPTCEYSCEVPDGCTDSWEDTLSHHGYPQQAPGRMGSLATSLLETLLLRRTPRDPRSKYGKVTPSSRIYASISHSSRVQSKRSRSMRSRREDRSKREDPLTNSGHFIRDSFPMRRSSSANQLTINRDSDRKTNSRNFNTKQSANAKSKEEAPEVVTNYVYDLPEKKTKRMPSDGSGEYEDSEFEDDEFGSEDEYDDDDDDDGAGDFNMRPFISEGEDEMAYFAHRMGGADFKLLRRHVLHPHGRIRASWDTFLLGLITCTKAPSLQSKPPLHALLPLQLLTSCGVRSFNTGVENDGKLHFSFQSIARHYTRGWFVPNLLWTVPFYAMFESHDPGVYVSGGSVTAPFFRFAALRPWLYPASRCLRLMRVAELPRLQRRLEYSLLISSKVSSLGSFLFVVLALSHVFSCVFAYLAFDEEEQLEFALEARLLQDTELKTRGRLFSLAAMIVGAGVFAYGITNVVSLFQQLYEEETMYRRDMDQVNAFMQARLLPRALRDKVRSNTFHWRKAARGEDKERDRAIVERMARPIRAKVADLFCEEMMPKKMPFLAGCSAEFVHDLYLRMHVQCYLPGEDIISQGDYGSDMFFLFAGHAQVLVGLTKVATFGPNSCFGEFSIANPRKPRLASIQALDFCETHCIDREQILRVLVCHPPTLRSARQLATLRSRKALTLIYESGGKSRTLLQGLAMMWRAEGIQGVLPAGVTAANLPLLQEFTANGGEAAVPGRRSSIAGAAVVPGRRNSVAAGVAPHPQHQLHQLHQQQQLSPAQILQLQQFNASSDQPPSAVLTSPTSPLVAAGVGLGRRRPSLAVETGLFKTPPAAGPVAVSSPLARQEDLRGRTGSPKRNIAILDAATNSPAVRLDKRAVPSNRRSSNATIDSSYVNNTSPLPKVRRMRSVSNIADSPRGNITSSTKLRGSGVSLLLSEQLEQLLEEMREMARRQDTLEQQVREVLSCVSPPIEDDFANIDNDRFDEQHWLDDSTAPLTRERSQRCLGQLGLHDAGAAKLQR
ncbi:hypothetical protein BBJ28_00011574 [Nothophytophthora sp. Chile5]|nr:hypothetical protein BBJ28_00011574 [Nothophytophthora sp. Chile5]